MFGISKGGILFCDKTGILKVAPGNKDIFISQVTMSGLENLLRVLKLYKFGYGTRISSIGIILFRRKGIPGPYLYFL